jgi:hypothetical protein
MSRSLPEALGTADEICQRLAVISHDIEAHAARAWLLERERDELRLRLRQLNWQSPPVSAGEPAAAESTPVSSPRASLGSIHEPLRR